MTRLTDRTARHRRCALCAGWLLLALAAALPAAAQSRPDLTELTLEELLNVEVESVYGASRYQQRLNEAPASVTVITAEEVTAYGWRTLADLLATAAGFHESYDRNYSYLGIRGFARPGDYNSRVLLLVDGHRLNDNVFDQAAIGSELPLDLDLIERVEIIRGPSSSLYGTSALLAAINIVTRRGRHLPGVQITAVGGSLGTGSLAARAAGTWRGAEVLVSASAFNSDGQERLFFPEFDGPGGRGIAERADADRADRAFASLAFGGWQVRAAYGSRKKHIPTAAFDTIFNDPRTWTVDGRGYVDVRYEKKLLAGSMTARAFHDRYRYAGEYRYADEEGGGYTNRDETLGSWSGGEAYFTSRAGGRHRLTVGGEFVRHWRQDQRNFDVDPPGIRLDDRRTSHEAAWYAQDHVRLFERLAVNASLRYDDRGRLRPTWSPRLAVIVDVTAHTTAKGIYGHVYRFPNAYEQYYQDASTQKTNPKLRAESVDTWEAQVDRQFGSRGRIAVSAFTTLIEDLIDQTVDEADGFWVFENLHRVKAKGVELEFDSRQQPGTPTLRGSYSLQWAEDVDTGRRLSNSPVQLGRIGVVVPFRDGKGTLAAEARYIGSRPTLAGHEAGAAAVVNVNLRRDLLPGFDIGLAVYNVLDKAYSDPGALEHRQDTLPRDGRTVRLMLRYRPGRH